MTDGAKTNAVVIFMLPAVGNVFDMMNLYLCLEVP